jgi:hypothetical protein
MQVIGCERRDMALLVHGLWTGSPLCFDTLNRTVGKVGCLMNVWAYLASVSESFRTESGCAIGTA